MANYNLYSPAEISEPCDLGDLDTWLRNELGRLERPKLQEVVQVVSSSLERFVRFSSHAILLWRGCDRIVPKGQKSKYHRYPQEIKARARELSLRLDGRANGPAICAFKMAGGERPDRWGSNNSWSIHHLYSGKYPFVDRSESLHAKKNGLHFTQSAGLVAVHPIADAMCDEFPSFAWRLRAEAYLRFEYDPDAVFSGQINDLGFSIGTECPIIYDDV